MRIRLPLIVALAIGVSASNVYAQGWDTPTFMPPRPGEDVGIYLSDADDFGVAGIWRQQAAMNLGVRVGYVEPVSDLVDGSIQVGVQTWDGIFSAGPDFPVDVTWTLGAGASFNDAATSLSVPGGLSIGRAFLLTPVTVQAYVHPRLALDIESVNDNVDVDLEGQVEVGGEAELNESWLVRVAASFAGVDALGVGLAYRFGRGVEVR